MGLCGWDGKFSIFGDGTDLSLIFYYLILLIFLINSERRRTMLLSLDFQDLTVSFGYASVLDFA